MATFATLLRQPIALSRDRSAQPRTKTAVVVDADSLPMIGLPNDDVYFFCKRIDNSRLLRQADHHATGEWSAIAGACAAALLVGAALIAPSVANIMDSYRLQDLKHDQADLRTEERRLDVLEERLINAPRLDALAPEHNLVRPAADQVIRLQPKNDRSFAMNGSFTSNSR
jgi:hypothetical protein